MYIGSSGWGWKAAVALHSSIVLSPGGSVSRNMPKLVILRGQLDESKDEQTILGIRLGGTNHSKRFRQHPLKTGMGMKIYRGHETCSPSGLVYDAIIRHTRLRWVSVYLSRVSIPSLLTEQLTQPSVMRFLSSVNSITSSSSSIVQVSLVECCFGTSSVVTTNLLPLSLPSKSPQVSRFISVFTFAIAKKRGSESLGKLTVLRSRWPGRLPEELALRSTLSAAVGAMLDE